jgi:hypothetical protein
MEIVYKRQRKSLHPSLLLFSYLSQVNLQIHLCLSVNLVPVTWISSLTTNVYIDIVKLLSKIKFFWWAFLSLPSYPCHFPLPQWLPESHDAPGNLGSPLALSIIFLFSFLFPFTSNSDKNLLQPYDHKWSVMRLYHRTVSIFSYLSIFAISHFWHISFLLLFSLIFWHILSSLSKTWWFLLSICITLQIILSFLSFLDIYLFLYKL